MGRNSTPRLLAHGIVRKLWNVVSQQVFKRGHLKGLTMVFTDAYASRRAL